MSSDFAILHVALNPVTGPWSVLRDLAVAQAKSGLYASVGIGVIHSRKWPASYAAELRGLGLPFFKASTLESFGTAQFVWQRLQKPPIGAWAQQLARQSRCERVIVHFHNAWMSGVFMPLHPKPACLVRCVATFHGVNAQLDGQPLRHRLHRWMAARLPRYGARLTSVDASNLPLAKKILGLNPASFTVIANGVADDPESRCAPWTGAVVPSPSPSIQHPASSIQTPPPRLPAPVSSLKVAHSPLPTPLCQLPTPDVFTVGHIGSIMERKGWRIAAEAVLKLRAEGLKIRLLIAGAGPEEEAARQLAAASGGAVEFLGHVSQPRRNLLPKLHALSVMSRHEGLPMTIIEAMAAGVPVVATAVGGIPEAVMDGRTGFLIPRSAESLAESLRCLYQSTGLWRSMSTGTRERFERQFEISHIVKQYDAVYRKNN